MTSFGITRRTCAFALGATTAALPAQSPAGPQHDLLQALTIGNQRFVSDETLPRALDQGTRRSLAELHRPYAIVVCPADSRLAPEHVFNTGLGELYVVRVAGNTCDPATLASIEFAAEHLSIGLCVVMGHDRCEALTIADAHAPASPAAERLGEHLQPALRDAVREGLDGERRIAWAAEENVYQTMTDAVRRSPILRHLIHANRFELVPATYRTDTGEVVWLPRRKLEADPIPVGEPRTARTQRVRGLPPHVALRMLHAGHRRSLSRQEPSGDVSAARRKVLVEGQRPFAIVLAEPDARVTPELLFDVGLGELYVIRVAGHFVDDEVLASVEQAIQTTGASLVVALGHDHSEIMQFALEQRGGQASSPSLAALAAWLEPAIEHARAEGLSGQVLGERATALSSVRALQVMRERSEIVRRAESEGLVTLLAGMYRVASGDLDWIEVESAGASHGSTAAAPLSETTHDPRPPAAAHEHRDVAAHSDATTHGPVAALEHSEAHHGNADHHSAAGHSGAGHGAAGHGSGDHSAAPHAPAPNSLLPTFLIAFGVAIGGVGAMLIARGRRQPVAAPVVETTPAANALASFDLE